MPRRTDHIERVSESFDLLAVGEQEDVIAELFTRLNATQRLELMRRLEFHMRMAGLAAREPRRRPTPIPPLLGLADVQEIGTAAIARTEPKKGDPVQ